MPCVKCYFKFDVLSPIMKFNKSALKISETVINRLSRVKQVCSGTLLGIFHDKTLYIIGLSISNSTEDSNVVEHLSTEVEICGVLEVNNKQDDQINTGPVSHVAITDTPVYLKVILGETNEIQANLLVNGQLKSTIIETLSEAELHSQFMHIRLRAKVPLICSVEEHSIQEGLQDLRKCFDSGKVIFQFQKKNVFLLCNEMETTVSGVTKNCTLGELYKMTHGEVINHMINTNDLDVLQVKLYKKVTHDGATDPKKMHAPIVCVDRKKYESLIMVLELDALSMVHRSKPLKELFEILLGSLDRNLQLLEKNVLKYFHQSEGDYSKISCPEIVHFYSRLCGHFVTMVYAKNQNERDLEAERKHLHKRFLLPLSRPIFRRANRYIFKDETLGNGLLMNPHEGLKSSGNGGEVAIVRGNYEYYHYCQNNMDDDGWGCAYRSLQTLASWFILQGYNENKVPTFKDIQKCLVDIGDKPSNFIGSRQWIGSTEVNFVLNSLLGISSRIIYCSSGSELANYGPDLIQHFKEQGSPIMIGGGVLAHTILGVDYNYETGSVKFLILDPHYTGGENLHTVQSKGWCGWKGINFWDKTAYYNMCLPQVPQCI